MVVHLHSVGVLSKFLYAKVFYSERLKKESYCEFIVKTLQTCNKEHGSSYAERISFEKEERVQTLTQAEPQTQTQTIAAQVEGTTSVTEEPVTSSPLGSEHQPDDKQKPVPGITMLFTSIHLHSQSSCT